MNILLTGGAGYIGSHTYVALCQAGYTPVILDNFSNSHKGVLARLQKLTGKAVVLEEGDVCDVGFVRSVLKKHGVQAVVHFAAKKSVSESIEQPLVYYHNNITGLVNLLEAMQAEKCGRLVYSGSATVYGDPQKLPITEQEPLKYTNVYGHTKLMGEQILAAAQTARPELQVAVLRYFNPVGAHESGTIGENPSGVPNNLMPYICQVAIGVRAELNVFGNDYATPDGTGVRDYLHVMDLAEGHVAALKYLEKGNNALTVNLGTGRGYSVLELVQAFEKASGKKVKYKVMPRRPGDIASCYADVSLSEKLLGWATKRGIDAICADAWRWQSQNPNGYAS